MIQLLKSRVFGKLTLDRIVVSQTPFSGNFGMSLVRQADFSSKWIAAAKFSPMALLDPAALLVTDLASRRKEDFSGIAIRSSKLAMDWLRLRVELG